LRGVLHTGAAISPILKLAAGSLVFAVLVSCGGGGSSDSAALNRPGSAWACVAPARPTSGATATTEAVYAQATGIREPTKIIQAPGDPSRWFVVQKGGQIKVFDVANPSAVSVYVDLASRVLSQGEGGFIGLAFHPDFPATPEIFVFYSSAGSPLVSRLSRLILDNPTTPTSFTEQILLTVNQPSVNHHGGDIAFGPDGHLYAGLGDGEPPAGTRPAPATSLRGAMLRIDVLGVTWPSPGYNIPADNPFAANPRCGPGTNSLKCPEIFAWGFRNPWRWSIDAATGVLWLADVGEYAWEEINQVRLGRNYGWPCREGLHSYDATSEYCAADLADPEAEYGHSQGDSAVTGGFVYRGNDLPALRGRYVYADYVSGRIFVLDDNGTGGYTPRMLTDTSLGISVLALGADGELYAADSSATQSVLHKLVPAAAGPADTIPDDLADTGCVDRANPAEPAAGMIPYGVNAPLWSDGADKVRYLALSANTSVTVDPDSGHWDLPPGTVLLKRFQVQDKLVETRLLMRHPDGVWAGYTYRWNDAGTVATRVTGGGTTELAGQTWSLPSEGQCMRCHTAAAGFSLGLTTAQLNGDFRTESGVTANQLTTLEQRGVLAEPLGAEPGLLPKLPSPADQSAPAAERARAYLDSNCSQCHQPGGPTPSGMDLRYTTPLTQAGICNVAPAAGSLGISNARLVAPGSAAGSVLLARMTRRDSFQMPPLGTNVVDAEGAALVGAWINGLASCN